MSAEGVRVSPEWLVLREPADAAARSAELAERLGRHLPAAGRLVIHDLGGGSGAMGRWLAPRLRGPQHWVVHDRDADLLESAVSDPPRAAADGTAVTVEAKRSDITRLAPGDLAGASLIVASALLDMLSADELAGTLRACAGAGCPVLLALTVVGRVALTPADPLDARMAAAFNAHQRRTTTAGRLLGPDAVAAAAEDLRGTGAEVTVRPSPWRLDPRHADLAAEWFGGWVAAACEQEPALVAEAAAYRDRRLAQAAAGELAVTVDHADLLGTAVTTAVRLAATVAILAFLVWHVGTGPFLDGLRTVDGGALAAAAALAVLTTVCCAWRWRIVAGGLGVDLPLGTAVAAYYRSLFLNVSLPGGVVGDVHRGYSHGRDTSDVGRGLRAVAWERSAGQVVQVVLTVAVLLAVPSPVRAAMPLVAVALLAAAVVVVLAARAGRGAGRSRWARLRSAAARDVRDGLLARRAWPAIALASALVVAGHAATFLIAARTAGVTAAPSRMLPLALLVLLAAALPNVGGWGPREGMTAWAFAAAGLGASQGVATAVVYGVMVFVACLPGAAFLIADRVRRARPAPGRERPLPGGIGVVARGDGAPGA